MRKYSLFIGIILLTSFQFKSEDNKIPSDLKKSTVLLIIRDFEYWKKTIEGNPNGYDDYAKNMMFETYSQTIKKVEKLFLDHNIKVLKQHNNEASDTLAVDYIFDFKIECTGGQKERDWWMCQGGFYFHKLNINKQFEPLGTTNQIVKTLNKKLKK